MADAFDFAFVPKGRVAEKSREYAERAWLSFSVTSPLSCYIDKWAKPDQRYFS